MDDPYDGSRRNYTEINITTLSRGGTDNKEATAVTSVDHPFVTGDYVTINGVGTGVPGDVYYSGTFQIVVLSNTSFKYQMLSAPSSVQAPGTITCVRERELFDAVMRKLPANCAIYLGHGVFESKGTTYALPAWEPKNGQRILGSGRGLTTLKLVNASWPEFTYTLIASQFYYAYIEDFEVSDLTFDCNIAGQPHQRVSCTAVWLPGKHLRLRRLRAINYGSQTTAYAENFVFSVAAPHPIVGAGKEGLNSIIEDCIAEFPGLSAANNSTIYVLACGENSTDGIMPYHRACAIRNCWIDGTYSERPVRISGITISAGVATVTTYTPHNRQDGNWVVIAGAVENGSPESAYNGTYQISNVSTYQFSYTPVSYLGSIIALPVPTTSPTGDMWIDRFSSHPISVQKVEKDSTYPTMAVLTTRGPHYRKPGQSPGQRLKVYTVNDPVPSGTEAYFGWFPIVDDPINSPNVLKYQMASAPSVAKVQDTYCLPNQGPPPGTPDDPPTCVHGTIFLGVKNVGFSTDGGSEAVAEGNNVFNTGFGGSYHDTFGTKDQTDRNNYYSDVSSGPYQNMGSSSNPKLALVSLLGNIATFTTTNPHGLVVGQAVRITSSNQPGALEVFYMVASVPTSSTFTLDTGGTALPGDYFGALWQVGLAVRENNIIELGQAHHVQTTWGYSTGLPFNSGQHDAQYVFRSVIVRNNVINLVPGSSNSLAQGIQLGNVERAVIENNLIDLLAQPPMSVGGSRPLHFFNNQSSSGGLIQPLSGTDGDDLRRRIEDALTLAL